MHWQIFLTVFATVFIAELGDKTQLATLLFATEASVNKFVVFAAAALALILSTAIAVLAGGMVSQYISTRLLQTVAGIGFIAIGAWTLMRA